MTEGLKRYYGAGHCHFITASCFQRRPFLKNPESRALFLHVLEDMRRRYRLVVLGYVVMPEHFHLLVSEPERKTLSGVIQALKLGFVRRMFFETGVDPSHVSQRREDAGYLGISSSNSHVSQNRRDVGHPNLRFWQKRFYDFNVFTESKRIEKLNYIHENPVRRGLVEDPEDWEWSSVRDYTTGRAGVVRVNDWSVMNRIEIPR